MTDFLVSNFSVSVRDPLWKDIMFTPNIHSITEHEQFQKLANIKQLGPTSLVYPGAVHTRLNHCLGVYHIARKMVMTLVRSKEVTLTKEGILSFLVAALLHDLGHFPFAHSLKDVVVRTHEALATDIILGDKSLYSLIVNSGANVDTVCSIIDPDGKVSSDKETILYQNLLSGALDPDKLDYLCRDAYFCGVPYGVQDVSWITEHIRIFNNRPALSVSDAGSVEHLLFSKYLMYRNVYWHEKTRCATAMVRTAVVSALKDGVITENDLYFLDDSQFITLCKSKNYEPFKLVLDSSIGKLFSLKEQFSCPKEFSEDDRKELALKTKKELGLNKDWLVIVDVPEPISFESNIPLILEDGKTESFSRADELFGGIEVSSAFTKALRKVRVFVPSEVIK